MSLHAARLVAVAVLALLPLAAAAQDHVVIYRCTDAAGNVTLQNDVACPPGLRQERQSVDVPPALPAYVPRETRMPAVVAAEQARQERRIDRIVPGPVPAGERKPPPALFQCATWDEVHYLTEDPTPQTHCAPLQVVAIAGTTPSASACEQVVDTCSAVPEAALCPSWKRRVDEAEFRWKFAGAASDGDARLEYEQLRATYDNSTCSLQGGP